MKKWIMNFVDGVMAILTCLLTTLILAFVSVGKVPTGQFGHVLFRGTAITFLYLTPLLFRTIRTLWREEASFRKDIKQVLAASGCLMVVLLICKIIFAK